MGVEVYPGFAGKEVLYDWHGSVAGVATGEGAPPPRAVKTTGQSVGEDCHMQLLQLASGASASWLHTYNVLLIRVHLVRQLVGDLLLKLCGNLPHR